MSREKEILYLKDFINVYKSETCLWKMNSPDYKDKTKKKAAYNRLVEVWKEVEAECNKITVLNKIKNLRSSYRKEFKKVRKSTKAGTSPDGVYVPKLWYYNLLTFLDNQEIPPTPGSNVLSENEISENDEINNRPMDNLGQQQPQNNHSNDSEMNNFVTPPQPTVVTGNETSNNIAQVMTNSSSQQHTIVNNVPVMGTLQTVLTQGLPSQNISANVVNTVNINHTPQTLPTNIQSAVPSLANTTNSSSQDQEQSSQILTRMRLQDLVREVDPNEQLDEDVEDVLLQMADDFVDSAITAGCLLAKHRKSNTVEVKDLQLHLERNWNMWIPGFGTDELRPYKRASVTEAHKQRLTLIRKTLKKY